MKDSVSAQQDKDIVNRFYSPDHNTSTSREKKSVFNFD